MYKNLKININLSLKYFLDVINILSLEDINVFVKNQLIILLLYVIIVLYGIMQNV